MKVTDYIKCFLPEEFYLVLTTVYLIKLDKLNKELLSTNLGYSAELITYNNWSPAWYFGIALILGFIGGGIIMYRVRCIRYDVLEFDQMIFSIVAIVLVIVLIILIIVYINNPIFRIIIAAVSIIAGVGYLMSH